MLPQLELYISLGVNNGESIYTGNLSILENSKTSLDESVQDGLSQLTNSLFEALNTKEFTFELEIPEQYFDPETKTYTVEKQEDKGKSEELKIPYSIVRFTSTLQDLSKKNVYFNGQEVGVIRIVNP